MSMFNVWASMSADYKSELWGYVRRDEPAVLFPAINDIRIFTKEFFINTYNESVVENVFREWPAAGRVYKLWSFYSSRPDEGAQIIRADLNMLASSDPQDFGVLGSWRWTGEELGNAEEPVFFEIPQQTIHFMPDVIIDDSDPDNPVWGRPSELTDVNLLAGQSPRSFDSYEAQP